MSLSAITSAGTIATPSPASAPAHAIGSASAAAALKALSHADQTTKTAKLADAGVSIGKSMTAARKEVRDATRTRVKETVERLKKELQLIKKLWAGDPKELARQVARIAKSLKAALHDYAQAAKDNGDSVKDISPSPDMAASAPAAPIDEAPSAAPQTTDAKASDAPSDGEKSPSPAPSSTETPATAPVDANTASAISAYGKAANDDAVQTRKDSVMEARGDLDFTRDLRDFVRSLRDVLQESRIRHAFNTVGRKDQLKAEEDAAKALGEVDKATDKLDVDVRADFPELTVPQAAPAAA